MVGPSPDDEPGNQSPVADEPAENSGDEPDDVIPPGPNEGGEAPSGQGDDGVAAGDLTGDGAVTTADRDFFLAALNMRAGQRGYDPALDYDEDEVITLRDYQAWIGLAYPQP